MLPTKHGFSDWVLPPQYRTPALIIESDVIPIKLWKKHSVNCLEKRLIEGMDTKALYAHHDVTHYSLLFVNIANKLWINEQEKTMSGEKMFDYFQ